MKEPARWFTVEILAALVAGQGLYWFIGGHSATVTSGRNTAVVIQIVLAAALALFAGLRRRREERNAA